MFDLNTRLLNNIAFAQALDGRLDEADRTISRRSNLVHVDSYITATRGLIELKKGHLEKAELLYDRAVGLAKTDVEKRRIRQRCLLELGKYWLPLDVSKSTRYFQRAHDFAKNDTDLILALQARRADALSRPLLR
jgi:tetratricopeptide (TPR) repeat protein